MGEVAKRRKIASALALVPQRLRLPELKEEEEDFAQVLKKQAKAEQEEKTDKKVKVFADPYEEERQQRRAWATSLGKFGVIDPPEQDLPAPAPSCGMWDLVRAEAKKRQAQAAPATSRSGSFQSSSKESLSQSPAEGEQGKQGKQLRRAASWDECKALKAVVELRVRRSDLWAALTITESEKRLRSRCLVEELCKQVWQQYSKVATSSAGSWEGYLKTSLGHQRVHQWLDKKLQGAVDACRRV